MNATMMRFSPQRSVANYALWSIPLTVLIAGLIWQFGWLPVTFDKAETGKVDSKVAGGEFDPQTGEPLDFLDVAAPLPLAETHDAAPVDPMLFTAQTEPDVEEDVSGGNQDALLRRLRSGSPSTEASRDVADRTVAPPERNPFERAEIPVDPAQAGLPPQRPPVQTADNQYAAEAASGSAFFPQREWRNQAAAPSRGESTTAARVPRDAEIRQVGNETVITPVRDSGRSELERPAPPMVSVEQGGGFGEPEVPAELAVQLAEIDEQIRSGNELVAHRELSKIYWKHPEWRDLLAERIDGTAKLIYFSPQPHYMEPYVVQPGDQLAKIAKGYHVPWEFLAKLNRIDPRRIRPDQKLKVIKGPFSAYVEVSRFELTIHAHGYYVKRYKIGVGKDNSTPIGAFKVLTKLSNPTYYPPEGGVVHADDPANPLGERWIDIGDHYGIHGAIDPDSIGKAESRGCIRLLNSDVEEVYDFLALESEVVISR